MGFILVSFVGCESVKGKFALANHGLNSSAHRCGRDLLMLIPGFTLRSTPTLERIGLLLKVGVIKSKSNYQKRSLMLSIQLLNCDMGSYLYFLSPHTFYLAYLGGKLLGSKTVSPCACVQCLSHWSCDLIWPFLWCEEVGIMPLKSWLASFMPTIARSVV